MGDPVVTVLVPMLGRPHRVAPLTDSIRAATTLPHRVLFLVTPGDSAVNEAVEAVGGERLEVEWEERGDYARKINAGFRHTSAPFVFTGADDLHFHPGWCEAALARFDDERVGVVGTNDLSNKRVMRGEHATHFLVRRSYVDRYGTIDEIGKVFHEGYPHEFVDDELVGTARARDAWAFAADSIVEHLHPMCGKAPMDDLYAQQGERMAVGRRIFRWRQRLWM